jgi:hypothetical protein
MVAYVIPSGGDRFRRVFKDTRSFPSRHEDTFKTINANKKALGFADLTVGMSKMRLAA